MKHLNHIIILILLTPFAYATGISGVDLDPEVVFEPGKTFGFSFTGHTNKMFDGLDYEVTLRGDELAKHVTLDTERWENLPKDSTATISGRIDFPDELTPPRQNLRVCFLESCPKQAPMCGRTQACAKIIVYVPQEGIYPQINLLAPNVNQGEPAEFNVKVSNSGKATIQQCTGNVEVFDLREEKKGEVQLTPTEPIESFKSASMQATFDTTGLKPGNYSAKATVTCDDITRTDKKTFRIGTLKVSIKDHTKELGAGGIRRFLAKVESEWNDPLKDVYANVRIYDADNTVSAKTATLDLEPWEAANLEAFIDTTELTEKEYDAQITVFYGGKSSRLDTTVNIVPAGTAEETVEEPRKEGISSTTLTIILVIVVIILTLVNVFLAVYRKKKE